MSPNLSLLRAADTGWWVSSHKCACVLMGEYRVIRSNTLPSRIDFSSAHDFGFSFQDLKENDLLQALD